jgi:hypothetical protein
MKASKVTPRDLRLQRDVLVSHLGGPIKLMKYIKTMDGFDEMDPDLAKNCKEKAFQMLSAFIYLDNSDGTKYGSLITSLQTQQSLGNNQYLTTITEANNVFSSHWFDNPSKKFSKKDKDKSDDENEERIELSFSQMEG